MTGDIKKQMIKRMSNLIIAFVFVNSIYAQETKSNSIIYFEGYGGFSVISDAGFAGGIELNYQNKKNLFSFRIIEIAGYVKDAESGFLIPSYNRTKHNNECALLFGKRWIQNNHSYSISGGISYNHFISNISNSDYVGLPLEANIIWFSSKKKNTIGNAITPKLGFKLFGSISKNSFVGVGISLGIGNHKKN